MVSSQRALPQPPRNSWADGESMSVPSATRAHSCRLWWRSTRACEPTLIGDAVLESGRFHLTGFVAWLAWAAVHLQFLAQSSLRVSVFVQWVWTYLTRQVGSRLIVNHRISGQSTRSTEYGRSSQRFGRPATSRLSRSVKGVHRGTPGIVSRHSHEAAL